MKAKEHYENLLGEIYGWMSGDFNAAQTGFLEFLKENKISPAETKIALDLGAGHGAQTAALLETGFEVLAVDFNRQLLGELIENNQNEKLTVFNQDIAKVSELAAYRPELIVCWGDTLAHLESFSAIENFLGDCRSALAAGGRLLLSFRDYSRPLEGTARFIPVKSDERRIMICFLEYTPEKVIVTDIVHEKTGAGWEQKISSYEKVRLTPDWVLEKLKGAGFQILSDKVEKGLVRIAARK